MIEIGEKGVILSGG